MILKTLKYYLPFYLAILFFIILATSCNVTKNLNKTKETTKENTEIKTVETTTITETFIDTLKTKKVEVFGEKEIDVLLAGDSIFEDLPEITITTKIVKGKVVTKGVKKAQNIPISIDRTIISNKTTTATAKKESSVKTNKKEIERTGGLNFNYLWWLLLLLIFPLWKWFRK